MSARGRAPPCRAGARRCSASALCRPQPLRRPLCCWMMPGRARPAAARQRTIGSARCGGFGPHPMHACKMNVLGIQSAGLGAARSRLSPVRQRGGGQDDRVPVVHRAHAAVLAHSKVPQMARRQAGRLGVRVTFAEANHPNRSDLIVADHFVPVHSVPIIELPPISCTSYNGAISHQIV